LGPAALALAENILFNNSVDEEFMVDNIELPPIFVESGRFILLPNNDIVEADKIILLAVNDI